MITIKTLPPFDKWLKKLADKQSKARILARIDILAKTGHFGDCKVVQHPVCELRFFFGSGYRVYYLQDGDNLVLLLVGGDKDSQQKDILKAIELAEGYLKSIKIDSSINND